MASLAMSVRKLDHPNARIVGGKGASEMFGDDTEGIKQKLNKETWLRSVLLRCIPDSFPIAPQPTERFRKNHAAMLAVVAANATNESMVVASEAESFFHFKIGQPPISKLIVEILLAILQQGSDRFRLRL